MATLAECEAIADRGFASLREYGELDENSFILTNPNGRDDAFMFELVMLKENKPIQRPYIYEKVLFCIHSISNPDLPSNNDNLPILLSEVLQ